MSKKIRLEGGSRNGEIVTLAYETSTVTIEEKNGNAMETYLDVGGCVYALVKKEEA